MGTLIHRRQVRPAADAARGPGATIGPLLTRLTAPLTWIGWLSVAGAVAAVIVWFWGWAMGGVPIDPGEDLSVLAVLHQFASLAMILLPAALEFGYPGVARRNPWLLRGTLLLALSLLSEPLTSFVRDWAALLQTGEGQLDQSDFVFAVMQTSALIGALLQALGWLAFLRGLLEARARPRNSVLGAFAVAGVAIWVGALLPSFGQLWASDRVLVSVSNAIGVLVGLGQSAATAGVAAALLVGAFRRLQPRVGWAFGVAAALAITAANIAILVQVLLGPLTRPDGSQDYSLLTVYTALNIGSSLLLFAACLAGIGRGTDARRVVLPRHRAYLVRGDRRVRSAGG